MTCYALLELYLGRVLEMLYNIVGFELPNTTVRKAEISGIVQSTISGQRRIVALHRHTMKIMGSTKVNEDGSWKIKLHTEELNKIIAICFDDSSNYNADVFDRLDPCAISFDPDAIQWAQWLKSSKYISHKVIPDLNSSILPNNKISISQKDVKGTIAKFVIDTNFNKGHFVDSSNAIVSIGPGGTNTNVSVGSMINGLYKISNIENNGNSTNSVTVNGLERSVYDGVIPLDFFSDGTALVHFPLRGKSAKANGTNHLAKLSEYIEWLAVNREDITPYFEQTYHPYSPKNIITDFSITDPGSYSFSFSIYPRTTTPRVVLFQNGAFSIDFSSQVSSLRIGVNLNGGNTMSYYSSDVTPLPAANTWTHYVISLGTNGTMVFKNGVQVYTNAVPKAITPYSGNNDAYKGLMSIGNTFLNFDSTQLYATTVCDIRIFKRQILQASEALSLMNESYVNGGTFNVNFIYNFFTNYERQLERIRKLSKNQKYETVLIKNTKLLPNQLNSILIDSEENSSNRILQEVVYSGDLRRKAECLSRYPNSASPLTALVFGGQHEIDTGITRYFTVSDAPQTSNDNEFFMTFFEPKNVSGIAIKSRLSSQDTYKNNIRGIKVYGSISGDFNIDSFLIKNHSYKAQTFSGQWTEWLEFQNTHKVKSLRIIPYLRQTYIAGQSYLGAQDLAFKITEEVPPDAIKARSIIIDIADNWGGTNVGIKHFCPTLKGNDLYVDDWSFYSTSEESASYTLKNACTLTQKNGPAINFSWKSLAGVSTNQRLILVAKSAFYMDNFNFVNFHDNLTSLITSGAKNIKIQVTENVVTDTTYNQDVPNSKVLYSGQVQQFLNISKADERFGFKLPIGKSIEARSVVFDFANNYGYANAMGIKRIEFLFRGEIIPYSASWAFGATTGTADAYKTFNTTLASQNSEYWRSNVSTNQRLFVQFDTIKEFDEIQIMNSGYYNNYITMSVKDGNFRVTLDPGIPSIVYGSAVNGSIFMGSFSLQQAPNDYTYDDGRFTLPLLSKFNTTEYSARSVVFDILDNYTHPDLAMEKILFSIRKMVIEPSAAWGFYFSDKDSTVVEKNLFSVVDSLSYQEGNLTSPERGYYKTRKNGKVRLIVVFPQITKFDKILCSLWRRGDYDENASFKNINIYVTDNVLNSSHCVFDQSVPGGSLLKKVTSNRYLCCGTANSSISYGILLDSKYDGSVPSTVLLLHPGLTSSSDFIDSSKYGNVLVNVGAPVNSDVQYNLSPSSLDFRNGYLTSERLKLYALSNNTFKIRCFVYSLSNSSDTTIMSKWQTTGNARSYKLSIVNGYLVFSYSTDGTSETNLSSLSQIPINAWTYIEVVRMWETFVIKINNSIDRSVSIGLVKFNPTHTTFCIGTHSENLSYCFNGFIDELEFSIGGVFDIATSVPMSSTQSAFLGFAQEPNSSFISLSFDSGEKTYKVFKTGAWRNIASCDPDVHGVVGDNDWYYFNASNVWSKSGVTNQHDAISTAIEVSSNNRNTYDEINALTGTQYSLIFDGGLSMACTSYRENTSHKSIEDIKINNKKYWYSSPVNLEKLISPTITSCALVYVMTKKEWESDLFTIFMNSFKVYFKRIEETEWIECFNNQNLSGISNGMATSGVVLEFMVEYEDNRNVCLANFRTLLELRIK